MIVMMQLHLKLLGWPTVNMVENGEETAVSQFASHKVQAILYYLVVTGQPCARDLLIGLFWPETSEKKARVSLRTALYNLQQQLPDTFVITRKSVALSPDYPITLDSVTFSQAVTNSDMEQVRHALTLYRGDFLEGFHIDDAPEFEYWRIVELERLRQLALTGWARLADYDEATGNTAVAISNLRHLLTLEPWREATHRRIMLLLARAGDYNSALKQYQQCVAILQAELDVPPMPETEMLQEQIITLRQRPPIVNLPPSIPTLIGRDAELVKLSKLLANPACRLIVITGMGGIGKTSLALALGTQQARRFLHGVVFVALADLETASLLDTAVADTLNITIPPSAIPRDYLCQQLQAQELLLILDNVEQLLPAIEGLLQALLQAAPNLKIIITSRETPRLRAANLFPLHGLSLPDVDETAVIPTAATTLFSQHAHRIQPNFSLVQAWPHVLELCHLLQGSPLGIELAAAQLEVISYADLARNLRVTVTELAVEYQDMPLRHRSLRGLFHHSWQILPTEERDALAKLSLFRGGFTTTAASHAVNIPQNILHSLLKKSLLQQQNGRFSLHTLIRQFAQEQLSNKTAVSLQHAHYFSQQLQTIAKGTLHTQADELLADIENIRTMWQTAITQQETSILHEATHGLARFYAVTNQFAEGCVLFAQAVEGLQNTAVPQNTPIVWGQLLGRYAMFLLRTGQLTTARDMAERSVAILRGTEDEEALAFSLNLLGILHIQSGSFDTAVPLLNECADCYRRSDNPAHLLKPLINLGSVQMRKGNYTAAIAYLDEAFPLAQQLDDRRGMTHILNNLGANYLALGDLEAAHKQLSACLPLTEKTDYQPVRRVVLQNLAEICYKQKEWTQAIHYAEASIAIATELEDNVQAIRSQKVQALAYYALDNPKQAWQILHQAIQLGYQAQALPALMDVLTGVGQLLLTEGNTAVAIPLLHFIRTQPATEQQYVQEAEALLAQAGMESRGNEEISLADMMDMLLPAIWLIAD